MTTKHTPELLAAIESIQEWCYPDAIEMPNDANARLEWYARRLLLIANAARAAIAKATGN